jgi:DNA-binding MarR family transcriptional regulator
MKSKAPDKADTRGSSLTIKDLLSYRIHRVSSLLSRSAAVRYRTEFDLSLGEWRALALLGGFAPMSLNQLAREADLDKAQMSRVVSGLVRKGFIAREAGSRRERAALVLTPAGERTYRSLMNAAAERNAAFLACLAPSELQALNSALAKLDALGRALCGPRQVRTSPTQAASAT